MHNVHDEAPALFHTRWALSYLRGPLTRTQIQSLMADRTAQPEAAVEEAAAPIARPVAGKAKPVSASAERPVLPSDVRQSFVPATTLPAGSARLVYRPALLGTADLHFANAKAGVDTWQTVGYVAPLGDRVTAKVWDDATQLRSTDLDLADEPTGDGEFADLPTAAAKAASYSTWEKAFKTHLYQNAGLTLLACPALKLSADPDETEAQFRVRVREAAREQRDATVEKLRKKYAPKMQRLEDRIRRAEDKLGRERSQYEQQKMQTAISAGATVLGALFGRKIASVGSVGRAATTARGLGRAAREKEDIARAQREIETLQQQYRDLETEFKEEIAQLDAPVDPDGFEFKEQVVRPRKSDIAVGNFGLVWLPWHVDESGVAAPAYE
jgi:molybdopterin converting factor small subunit